MAAQRRRKRSKGFPPIFIYLNCLDFLVNFSLRTFLLLRDNGINKWHLFQPLMTSNFWGCSFVFLACTFLMMIFIHGHQFKQNSLLYWILKDLVAVNAIGFHYSKKPFGSTAIKAALSRNPAHLFRGHLASVVKLIYWLGSAVFGGISSAILSVYMVLHWSRYLIMVGLLVITICVVQEHTKALVMHKEAVEDASTVVAESIDWHGYTVDRALKNHSRQIHKASRSIENGMLGSSRALSSSIDRHAAAFDKAIRSQNRQIEASTSNVITAIHMSADTIYEGSQSQGYIVAGAIKQVGSRRQQQMIEYRQRTERRVARIDNGLSLAAAGIGLVAPLAGALATCNVM